MEIQAKGTFPCRRNSHTTVYDNGKMYVFGGWENNRNILNDVFEFDFGMNNYFFPHPPSETIL